MLEGKMNTPNILIIYGIRQEMTRRIIIKEIITIYYLLFITKNYLKTKLY